MPNIILVRHGQASFGTDNYDRLSDLGKRQSLAVGRQLRRSSIIPASAVAGQMQRQQDTALLALEGGDYECKIKTASEFNEFDSDAVFTNYLPAVLQQFPDVEGRLTDVGSGHGITAEVFAKAFFPVMKKWIAGDPAEITKLEPWDQFRDRVLSGLDDMLTSIDKNQTGVIFTSGGVISVILAYALGTDWERMIDFNWRTANGSITQLAASSRGLSLDGYNHHTHMQSDDDSLEVTYL